MTVIGVRLTGMQGQGRKTHSQAVPCPCCCLHLTPPPSHLYSSLIPPNHVIPCIHAIQGPIDCDPKECEGNDSLEQQRVAKLHTLLGSVLGKRKEQLPPFPYCLKCHSKDPGHLSDECPYSRTCQWCWSTYHSHLECPSPHLTCSTTKCIVPLNHVNVGTVCVTILRLVGPLFFYFPRALFPY